MPNPALLAAAQRAASQSKSDLLAKKKAAAASPVEGGKVTRKKYKGKYVGPDKYKGVAQQGKKKYKGKYAGPDKYKGMARPEGTAPTPGFGTQGPGRVAPIASRPGVNPIGMPGVTPINRDQKYFNMK